VNEPTQNALVCAIHQPNFFPWLGYFDKIRKADIFVFLDDVAYPKSGSGMGSWTNRVRLNVHGTPRWLGCPIRRQPGPMKIRDARIDDDQPWRKKMLRTLEINYGRAPNFSGTMDLLRPLILQETENLAEFNKTVILAITAHLGLHARFVCQSGLATQGAATELLIEVTRAVGAGIYLCGGGAAEYQDDALFAQRGVVLRYQNFVEVSYGSAGSFRPGLSVIDYLMNGLCPGEKPCLPQIKTSSC